VTREREASVAMEATRIIVVHAAKASTQEAAVAGESVVALVKDAEDRATLAKGETWERVPTMEVESATTLAYAHEEAEGLARRIAPLKGELAKACPRACPTQWLMRTPGACQTQWLILSNG
jgi:hypothetical protein